MTNTLIAVIAALPIGAVFGWFANRLFAPTFDELGNRLKGWLMTRFSKDEYSTYVAYTALHKLVAELHTNSGHNVFNEHKPYLNDHDLNLEIKSKTNAQLRNIAEMWVRQSRIGSYSASDIFFAGLELLLPHLSRDDMREVFTRYDDHSQANLWPFLEIVEVQRPDLLAADILQYLRDKQKEWSDKVKAREEQKLARAKLSAKV